MRFMVFLFLVGFSFSAFSIEVVGKVERIFPTADHVNFRLKNDTCKSIPHNTYWKFSLNSEVGKAWFSMLLAAANTDSEIKVHASACEPTQSSDIWFIIQDFQ